MKIKYIRHHKTPICPRCGSNKTGRFVLYTGLRQERVIDKYLKNAEFVMPVTDQLSEYNLFCLNCGIQWRGPVTIQYICKQELGDIKRQLGTDEITSIEILNQFYGKEDIADQDADQDIEDNTQDIIQHGKILRYMENLMVASLLSPFKALQDVKDAVTPDERKNKIYPEEKK